MSSDSKCVPVLSRHQNLRHRRRLLQALVISGLLNAVLIAIVTYSLMREREVPFDNGLGPVANETRPSSFHTCEEAIRYFRGMTLDTLISKLENSQVVEEGISIRDLALGCLITFHHFDVPRALLGCPQPSQQKQLVIDDSLEICIYPGLTEEQFQAIIHFGTTEQWPLTSYGLFQLLQHQDLRANSSLTDAFSLTPEFLAIETLFDRADVVVEKTELLDLVCSGEWSLLSQFARKQRRMQNLSRAQRQHLLVDYLACGASPAAYLMLKTEEDFAYTELDDVVVATLLQLFDTPTQPAERFAKQMLISERSDAVWRAAASCLYRFSGESMPERMSHDKAIARFIGNSPNNNESFRSDKKHIIQRGDTLWKISKQYNVDIDCIKETNHLISDVLTPGKTLTIPKASI